MEDVASMVKLCPPIIAREACNNIAGVLEASDDYSRKAILVRWYQALASLTAIESAS